MENLEIRLKCVELLIDAYKKNNKGQFVTIDDIIYQADRLTDFIKGVDYIEEGLGYANLNKSIDQLKINSAIERLEKLKNSVSSTHLIKELATIYYDLYDLYVI